RCGFAPTEHVPNDHRDGSERISKIVTEHTHHSIAKDDAVLEALLCPFFLADIGRRTDDPDDVASAIPHRLERLPEMSRHAANRDIPFFPYALATKSASLEAREHRGIFGIQHLFVRFSHERRRRHDGVVEPAVSEVAVVLEDHGAGSRN